MKTISSIKYILVTVLAAKVCFVQAQTNRSAAVTDYSKIQQHIADRNIFDPNRVPERPSVGTVRPPRTNPPIANSFSLVGTMNYGEGDTAGIYAFFDGSSTKFRKAAVLNDGIAVFKIVAINKESVTLVQNTNKVVLKLGDQMRDDTKGNWRYYGQAMASYSQNDYGRSASYSPSSYDPRGRNNGRSYNSSYRTAADPNGSSYNRNQRNFQRGGPIDAAGQDFPQDPQAADFGGFPDGTPLIIPDFTAPPDAPAEE